MRRLAALLTLLAAPLAGQAPDSIPWIMRGPELYGREPQNVRWTPDGRFVYFDWLPAGSDYRARTRPFRAAWGGAPEEVSLAHMDTVAPLLTAGDRSREGTRKVVSVRGDLFVVHLRTSAVRRLTQTVADELQPRFSVDGGTVYFVRDNNAFAFQLADGGIRQLTDIRTGPAPRDSLPAQGQKGALEGDQRFLFEVIRDRSRADSLDRAERRRLEGTRPPVTWLERDERVTQVTVSPTGRFAILVTSRPASGTRRAEVPNYVTSDGYTEMIPARDKVGDAQPPRRIGVLTVATGQVRWVDATPTDSSRTPAQLGAVGWNPSGTAALLIAVSADYTTRWYHTVRGDSMTVKTIDVLVDSAWVGGPCFGCAGWVDDARVWYVSEATGYAHLYLQGADATGRRALTEGRWEVLRAELSPDRRTFWLHHS